MRVLTLLASVAIAAVTLTVGIAAQGPPRKKRRWIRRPPDRPHRHAPCFRGAIASQPLLHPSCRR